MAEAFKGGVAIRRTFLALVLIGFFARLSCSMALFREPRRSRV